MALASSALPLPTTTPSSSQAIATTTSFCAYPLAFFEFEEKEAAAAEAMELEEQAFLEEILSLRRDGWDCNAMGDFVSPAAAMDCSFQDRHHQVPTVSVLPTFTASYAQPQPQPAPVSDDGQQVETSKTAGRAQTHTPLKESKHAMQ